MDSFLFSSNPLLGHGDDCTNAVALLHDIKSRVDLGKRFAVGDELINLELAVEVVLDEAREL